jgi:nicotinamide-nucleotide amidase
MKTEIIAIGSELLSPYFQDTNSLFLTERLNDVGLAVSFKTLVGDDERDLLEAVRTALRRSRLVIAVGGLGPTEDDRTREAFAEALGRKLVFNLRIMAGIRQRFLRRGAKMSATNRKQGFIIEGAEALDNPHGTAPGLWIETPRHRIALLPGPPHELQPMFEDHVRPRLEPLAKGITLRRVLRLTGIGESLMESRIKDIYSRIPAGIAVTTLASPGDLAVHLVYHGNLEPAAAAMLLDSLKKRFAARLGPWIYSEEGESLEAVVGRLLSEKGLTLACAESCTGGLLGHRLTNIPGSSAYFLESAVVYSNRSKTRRLGVPPATIRKHGAVSAAVAKAMAVGIKRSAASDYGLAITGIAGPDGGTARKPVGLVYVALAKDGRFSVEKSVFWGGRERVKFQSSQKALDVLRRDLIKTSRKKYNGKGSSR